MRILVDNAHNFLHQLPDYPGVYRFYAADDQLLYVGKANNLLKRVKSYFQKLTELSPRIQLMVKKISEIEVTVTSNETSALLLETNLIKALKPKYNIIFRDDKTYPLVRITQHQFPLIEYFRGKPGPRELVFGPYPNSTAVKETLNLLQRLFKLRTCSDNVFANRTRPCMLYQVHLCSAPCVGKINQVEYSSLVRYALKLLRGKYTDLLRQLSLDMYCFAENHDFEQAAVLRDQISLLKELQAKQIISDSQKPINADIVVYRRVAGLIYIYLIVVRNGLYVGDKQFSLPVATTVTEVVEGFIEEYYNRAQGAAYIYLRHNLSPTFLNYFGSHCHSKIVTHNFPERVAELMTMAEVNLGKIIENVRVVNIYQEAVSQLGAYLKIESIQRIECYDTSHNHGSSAVAAMVAYANGKIDPALYRKYNLSESVNGDDLRALSLVLKRRLANHELEYPQVILVDGGENQLLTAKNLLNELGICDKIKVIAIFKGLDRKPELDKIIINQVTHLSFNEQPQLFKLVQALRDEAHRFAIAGHRKKQAGRMKLSKLEDIPGIGVAKRKALIIFFGSAQNVAAATVVQLQQVNGIGIELAQAIYDYFHV